MAKIDIQKVLENARKLYGKTKKFDVSVASDLKDLDPKNFIKMPDWWSSMNNTPGLPFGKTVQIAGDSDSGKTTFAMQAMKAAQEQDISIIYVETEGKTTPQDFLDWGVDPETIMVINSSVAEIMYQRLFVSWDAFFELYPDKRLLVVIDSIGNIISQRDAEIDLSEMSQKPGGKGAINRLMISKLTAKRDQNDVAVLLINYTYDNIGSPGKTNAGGKALNFFSSITYQTSRKSWIEKTVCGVKRRVGAVVIWKLFKNHINKSNPGLKQVELKITGEGMSIVNSEE